MGCCGSDKACSKQQNYRKPIPWFRIVLFVLFILVVINWK